MSPESQFQQALVLVVNNIEVIYSHVILVLRAFR